LAEYIIIATMFQFTLRTVYDVTHGKHTTTQQERTLTLICSVKKSPATPSRYSR